MKPETVLQRNIMRALEAIGEWPVRTAVNVKRSKVGQATGEPGLPDLLLVGLGHIEVKLPGEGLDPDQVIWHKKAANRGVRVGVAHSPLEAVGLAQQWRLEWHRMAQLGSALTLGTRLSNETPGH